MTQIMIVQLSWLLPLCLLVSITTSTLLRFRLIVSSQELEGPSRDLPSPDHCLRSVVESLSSKALRKFFCNGATLCKKDPLCSDTLPLTNYVVFIANSQSFSSNSSWKEKHEPTSDFRTSRKVSAAKRSIAIVTILTWFNLVFAVPLRFPESGKPKAVLKKRGCELMALRTNTHSSKHHRSSQLGQLMQSVLGFVGVPVHGEAYLTVFKR